MSERTGKEVEGMKEFTKSDLKNRMVVEYRNGDRRMVVDGILMGISGYGVLSRYNDVLINKNNKDNDIVKVYRIVNTMNAMRFVDEDDLIWERSEVKEVTLAEVEEKFGCKVKIVKE